MSSYHDYPIIEFDKVSFSYSGQDDLIKDMDIAVSGGQFIGLLGANGSGKSTILKLLSGFLRPSSGVVRLWGKNLHTYRNRDRAKLISYLPQVLDMNIPFKVKELVSMGLYPYEIMPQLTVEEAIDMVGLRDKAEAGLTSLSGGERRRAFIAMTLLQGAGILLFDEPLANLDIKYQVELLCMLRELRDKKGITIIMALHDINMALKFERVILIRNGRILRSGPPEATLTEEAIRDAFDLDVEIKTHEGRTYIHY
ncbi:MAG: ABC transporter ATP-binding protein [Thermodesulfovibrionales bacterium]